MNNNKTKYKDSPLGKIPNDWEVKRIGKMTKTTAGGTPSTSVEEYWGGNIKWMSSGELNLKRIYDVEGRITELGLKNSSTKIIPIKCILIGLAGQGKTRGTVAMNMVELCTNQSVAAIFPGDDFYEDYLFYNLDYRYEELRQLSTGEGGRGGLNLNIINSVLIPLPPLPEQKAIAHVLGLMDSAIKTNNQLIAKKELRKKWLMQNLLTEKKRLKGFGSEWKEYKISQLGQIVTGNTPSLARPEYFGDKYCWATAFDFKGVYIDETDIKLSEEGKNVARLVPRGSILVTCIASIGKNAIANVEMAFNQQINAIVPNENFYSEFIYYIIENSSHKLREVAGAGAVSIINKSNFESRKLRFPIIEEQTAIAKVLQGADKEIQLLKIKTEKLREQKKGLMQVLLTGKKRLTFYQ